MKITVKYGAWSDIGYKGTQTFEFDDADWKDMDAEQRRQAVQEEWETWLNGDISYDIEDADEHGI